MSIAYRPQDAASPQAPRNDPEYVEYLERRITALESRVPRTRLLSHSFLDRSFAVLGHYLVAAVVLEAGLLVLFGIGMVVVGVLANAPR